MEGNVEAQQPGDGTTLMTLYNATGGPNWTNNTNWGNDKVPLGDWHGITTNSSGRVTHIDLMGNNLSGTIPAGLDDLDQLEWLNLGHNHHNLVGQIPADLGNLSNLKHLDLRLDGLTGEIPAELGSIATLEVLILRANNLSGSIPAELANLTALSEMRLDNNNLTGSIPSELESLTALQTFTLHQNSLTGTIPSEFGNLAALQRFLVYDNSLKGSIPVELGNLTNLLHLFLEDHDLTGDIPSELGNLDNLLQISLNDNSLSGTLPSSLGSLPTVNYLDVSSNDLTGEIPESFLDLQNLTVFQFDDNGNVGAGGLCMPDQQAFLDWKNSIPAFSGPTCEPDQPPTTSTTSTTSTTQPQQDPEPEDPEPDPGSGGAPNNGGSRSGGGGDGTVSAVTTTTTIPVPSFSDVSTSVHRSAIGAVAAAGIITGYPDGTFRPGQPVTRGQVASMLRKAMNLQPRSDDPDFVDVTASVHASAIRALAAAEVISGYSDGTFRPDQHVTRAQLASIFAKALGLGGRVTAGFSDVTRGVHVSAIGAVVGAGIMTGYGDGMFGPNDTATRGQLASMINRAFL